MGRKNDIEGLFINRQVLCGTRNPCVYIRFDDMWRNSLNIEIVILIFFVPSSFNGCGVGASN